MIYGSVVNFGRLLERNKLINTLANHNYANCAGVLYLDSCGKFNKFIAGKSKERIQVSTQKRTSGIASNPIVNNLGYYEIPKRFDAVKKMVDDFSTVCNNKSYSAYRTWIFNGIEGYETIRPLIYKDIFKETELDQIAKNNITPILAKKLDAVNSCNIIICVEDVELHKNTDIINAWERYKEAGEELITCPITFEKGVRARIHRPIMNGVFMSYTDDDSTDMYVTTRTESLFYETMNYLKDTQYVHMVNGKEVTKKLYFSNFGNLKAIYFTHNNDNEIIADIASDPLNGLFDVEEIDSDTMKTMCNVMKGKVAGFTKSGVVLDLIMFKPPASQGRSAFVNHFQSISFANDIETYANITSGLRVKYDKNDKKFIVLSCIPTIADIISVTVDPAEDPNKKMAIEFTNAIITSILTPTPLPKILMSKVLENIRHFTSTRCGDPTYSFSNKPKEQFLSKCIWVLDAICSNINYHNNKGIIMNLNNDVPYILGKWFAIQCQTAYHASDFKFGTNPIYQLSANFERKPIDTFAKIESKVYPHRSKLSRDKEGLYIKYSKLSLELMSKVESIPTSALGANFYLGYNHQLAEFMTKKES